MGASEDPPLRVRPPVDSTRVVRLVALERVGHDLYSTVRGFPTLFCSEPLRRCVLHQMFTLLAGLHVRGYLHRDIKLQNMLLQWVPWGGVAGSQLPALLQQQLKDLPGYPLLRLCDLGASRLAPLPLAEYCAPAAPVEASEGGGGGGGRGGGAASWDSGKKQSRGMGATSHVCARWYRAPELLCGSMFYGPPSDVWSMALAAAELYTLSASLSQDAVALGLSARRGDAFGDTLPMDGEKMNPILAREEWQKAGWEEGRVCGPLSRRDRCRVTLFHGSCDATQLLSVLNVLGTPNDAQVADMRLPSACRVALEALREAACAAAGEGVAAAAPWPQQALAGLGLGGGVDAAAAAPASLPPLDVAKLLSAKFAIPPDVAGMLSGMLKWAPSARTTAAEALRHEALSGSGVGFPA